MTAAKRVAVVGAGPSGLVTVKELLAEGHEPTCFEQAAGLGGVFRFEPDEAGVVWESCRLTSSGTLTAFSDFPVDPGDAGHMPVGRYVAYLQRYCDAFTVTPHLRFATRVDAVRRDADGGWTVTTTDPGGTLAARFDAVAVCSGLHQHPHTPDVPGRETFTGEVIHGARYRRPADVAGKRVLIVGAGESGADVVAEVAEHAAETVLSLRRGVGVQRRIIHGFPGDYRTSRLGQSSAQWVFHSRHPQDDWKRRRYRNTFVPFVVLDKILQLLHKAVWEQAPLVLGRDRAAIRLDRQTRALTQQLLAESGGVLAEQFGTKSDEFVRAIARGRCRRAPAIARFDGPRVVFADGSAWTPDLVIFCTGFETRAPVVDAALAAAPRYQHTFHPGVGASLAFIGFVRPAFGAIPPLAELQARWFALLQSGRRMLPPEAHMDAGIAGVTDTCARFFRPVGTRLPHLVDHTSFCDALAAEIGCKPTVEALARETRAFRRRFFAAPFVAAQYRLVGPHAEPELARRVIAALPIVHPVLERANLHLRWRMTQVLHRWYGPEFAPKLALE